MSFLNCVSEFQIQAPLPIQINLPLFLPIPCQFFRNRADTSYAPSFQFALGHILDLIGLLNRSQNLFCI